MKLRNRIKRLMFIVCICFVIYVFYVGREFLPKPLSAFTAIKDEYNQMCIGYENMHQNFLMNKYYKDREKELLYEKYNLNVLTFIKQEEILKILHGYLSSCNISLTKLDFSEAFPVLLNNSMDETIEETDENNYPTELMMSVNIEFNSYYNDMLCFIDGLQNNSIDMSITNLSTTFSEGDIVFVSMGINFYAVTEDFTIDFFRKQE